METETGVEAEEMDDINMDSFEDDNPKRCRFPRRQRQTVQPTKICAKDERNASLKKISSILQKSATERTSEESQVLSDCSEVVEEIRSRWRRRDEAKRRLEEFEEPPEILRHKCQILAQAIAQSQHLVVYTGAGISTAAKIPDYRGPNGIWTRLQQGKDIGAHDLTSAQPTFTHMALAELYRKGILKYVVSQNCDGLHLRSGLPRTALSELHGNMYIEVCKSCHPHKEYWRTFDVTENTARYSHKTLRKCYVCGAPLVDTIVHFGERGSLQWPLNWSGACKNAQKATTILCLGSSLKVLKKYPWLWRMDKPAKQRPNLYIVNLQWTPKDDVANVKLHGKCDVIMRTVMKILDIEVPPYDKCKDPIFVHATPLAERESHTTSQPSLADTNDDDDDDVMETTKQEEPALSEMETKQHKKEESDDEDGVVSSSSPGASEVVQIIEQNKDCPLDDTQSEICDKVSNNDSDSFEMPMVIQENTSGLPKNHHAPVTNNSNSSSPSKRSTFLIDDILQDTIHKTSTYSNDGSNHCSTSEAGSESDFNDRFLVHSANYPLSAYNSCYPPTTTATDFFHHLFGTYTDFLYYPYQTSFLYPGLHSIINPISPAEYTIDDKFGGHVGGKRQITQPSCDYCDRNYDSVTCLFYEKSDPVFVNRQLRLSKSEQTDDEPYSVCLCCEFSTNEENLDFNTTASSECTKEQQVPSAIDKDQLLSRQNGKFQQPQPGWFGKGYKKGRRPKKRLEKSSY